jgi:hypothetical protein
MIDSGTREAFELGIARWWVVGGWHDSRRPRLVEAAAVREGEEAAVEGGGGDNGP